MSLILPRGIVKNSESINGSIERIAAEPLDLADIAKFWKVYTTTQRRLLDPTAERLENYWWRIWGSRKRELNGTTVARLFAHISDGETFVPLRGPPNRDEGTPPLHTNSRLGPGASSTTAIHRSDHSRPSTTSSSTTSRNPVPMPHPILKKTRGPSTSGPRPTARFISPPESEAEADRSSSVSANSQTNSHVVVEPPSPSTDPQNSTSSERKSSPSLGKKKGGFAGSGRKKRPVIVRRQSSQTSHSSTEAIPSITTVQSSSERTPPTYSEQSRNPPQSRLQENFPPTPERTKTSKKRNSLRTPDSRRTPPRKPSAPGPAKSAPLDGTNEKLVSSGDPGPTTQLGRIKNFQDEVATEGHTVEDIDLQKSLLSEANARVKNDQQASDNFQILHRSLGSKSDGEIDRKTLSAVRLLDHETKSTTSIASTLTDATGQVDLGDFSAVLTETPNPGSSSRQDKGKGRDPGDISRAAMFAKRPVQPVQAAVVPDETGSLTRSKSQLTLLLERDRARSGEHKSDDEKRNRRKR